VAAWTALADRSVTRGVTTVTGAAAVTPRSAATTASSDARRSLYARVRRRGEQYRAVQRGQQLPVVEVRHARIDSVDSHELRVGLSAGVFREQVVESVALIGAPTRGAEHNCAAAIATRVGQADLRVGCDDRPRALDRRDRRQPPRRRAALVATRAG
jgi:hypothetical protein